MNTLRVVFGLAIVFALAFVAGTIIWNRRRKKSRSRVMAGWALSRNWSFTDADDSELKDRYPFFECLQRLAHFGSIQKKGPGGN